MQTEVVIVVQNGQHLDDIIDLALHCVKSEYCSYVMFRLNDEKIFVLKNDTFESVTANYNTKFFKS